MEENFARASPEKMQAKEKHFQFSIMLLETAFLTLVLLIIYFLSPLEIVSISSNSMEPTLPVNSISIAVQTNENTIYQVGDIITFSADYGGTHYSRITHRIVSIDGDVIRTKGDHNETNDPFTITREQIRNKVKWENIFRKN